MTVMETRPQHKLTPCPSWCFETHLPPEIDDGVHCSEPLTVLASQHMRDDIDYPEEINVNVHQEPGQPPLIHLGHHDGMAAGEDVLTPEEAEQVAAHLNKNASIIRANGDHTCWCDGMHGPGDIHSGELERVFLSNGPTTYEPAVLIAINRDWDAPAAVVGLTSHDERTFDELTPDEADQLAARLRDCIAIIRNEQGAGR